MLVTGAARRVGRSIALALAAAGAHIVVHYHSSAADAQATAHAIKSHGVDALPLQADQADPAQVTALFAAVRAHFGRLDGLINSASAFDPGDFLDVDLAHWQHTFEFLVAQNC